MKISRWRPNTNGFRTRHFGCLLIQSTPHGLRQLALLVGLVKQRDPGAVTAFAADHQVGAGAAFEVVENADNSVMTIS